MKGNYLTGKQTLRMTKMCTQQSLVYCQRMPTQSVELGSILSIDRSRYLLEKAY